MAAGQSSHSSWLTLLMDLLLVTGGAVISAASIAVFLAPSQIAPGGVSGLAIIINHFTDIPIGLMVLIGNIPIQIFAYRMLGGGRVLLMTVYCVIVFSVAYEILEPLTSALTDDALLNALFGGIVGGIGAGFIYRSGATAGGTATLARILQNRFGYPLSSAYLYTDTGVILLAGAAFGWEPALLAIVALFVSGLTSDYVLEGPSLIRIVTIITDHPDEVSQVLLNQLHRGVTSWEGTGMYTHQEHHILFVTVTRPQVKAARQLILSVDPNAFIVIGQGHVAFGVGFKGSKVEKKFH